jgi:hypothetical protein
MPCEFERAGGRTQFPASHRGNRSFEESSQRSTRWKPRLFFFVFFVLLGLVVPLPLQVPECCGSGHALPATALANPKAESKERQATRDDGGEGEPRQLEMLEQEGKLGP